MHTSRMLMQIYSIFNMVLLINTENPVARRAPMSAEIAK